MLSVVKWIVYDLTGIRWVFEHFWPPTDEEKKNKRPAPTGTIWVIGVYTALFGLASARYENAVDRVEIRAGAVVALLANDNVRAEAASQVAVIQQRMVPKRPRYGTFFFDSFWKRERHQEAVDMMKTAVESCKKELEGADLSGADLSGADLRDANLERSNLGGAILRDANLQNARLYRAILTDATLRDADLWDADLSDVKLVRANLVRANLIAASLWDADLSGANLTGAILTFTDLKSADLRHANLQDADLISANLEGVKFEETNLRGTDLLVANFTNSRMNKIKIDNNACWQDLESMKGAVITGWEEMPSEFVTLAFLKGAEIVDTEEYKWIRMMEAYKNLIHYSPSKRRGFLGSRR